MESRRVELVTRTSDFIHYVILLHKYIELPILYKYFGIFYCESEIKYSENVYSKIMSQGQKRPQNSSDCSICNLDFKNLMSFISLHSLTVQTVDYFTPDGIRPNIGSIHYA